MEEHTCEAKLRHINGKGGRKRNIHTPKAVTYHEPTVRTVIVHARSQPWAYRGTKAWGCRGTKAWCLYKCKADGKSVAANPDSIGDPAVLELLQYHLLLPVGGLLDEVGLDAANKMWCGGFQSFHEMIKRVAEVRGNRLLFAFGAVCLAIAIAAADVALAVPTLAHPLAGRLHRVRVAVLVKVRGEQLLDNGVSAFREELHDTQGQRVAVLLKEAVGLVANLAGKVCHGKLKVIDRFGGSVHACLLQRFVEFGGEGHVGGFGEERLLVQDREQALAVIGS